MKGGPTNGVEQLGNSNAAIMVAVNQGEGLFVEVGAGDGTGQGDPEFLIEFRQVDQIIGGGNDDLVEPADADKIPDVSRGGRGRRAHKLTPIKSAGTGRAMRIRENLSAIGIHHGTLRLAEAGVQTCRTRGGNREYGGFGGS